MFCDINIIVCALYSTLQTCCPIFKVNEWVSQSQEMLLFYFRQWFTQSVVLLLDWSAPLTNDTSYYMHAYPSICRSRQKTQIDSPDVSEEEVHLQKVLLFPSSIYMLYSEGIYWVSHCRTMNEWINVISISVLRINSHFLLHLLCKKFACKLDYSLLYLSVLYSIQGNKQIVPPNIIADTRRRKWHSLLSFYGDSLYVYRGPNRVGPLQKKKPQFSFLLLIFIGRERRTAAFFLKQTMATV